MPLANHLQRDTPALSTAGAAKRLFEDGWRHRWGRLVLPLEEILVAGHDEVSQLLAGQGDEVVVVNVAVAASIGAGSATRSTSETVKTARAGEAAF